MRRARTTLARARRRDDDASRPTVERLRQSGDDFERGHTGQLTMRDSPLERALRRQVITPQQHSAGIKYRHHWYHAGLAGNVGAIDLDRVFARDVGNYSGMAKTEAQVFHRQRYREAVTAIGLKGSYVVEWAICREEPLERVGQGLGWNNRTQAIAAATETLRTSLDTLCLLWGVGG